jgi:hypothetical protein
MAKILQAQKAIYPLDKEGLWFCNKCFLPLNSAAIQAGKITFVRENNFWIANLDGNTQKQLTFSGLIEPKKTQTVSWFYLLFLVHLNSWGLKPLQ